MAKDNLAKVKVLIAVVNPDQDPTIDETPFQFWFKLESPFPSPEDQWRQEGPILKVARKLFTPDDLQSARVFLLYTRLSQGGLLRRKERIEQGISLRADFEQAEERAKLTEGYLKHYLGISPQNILLWPLDFDNENVADLTEWLHKIPNALKSIKAELSKGLGKSSSLYSQYEFHIVCMGAAQVRAVFIGCCIGKLIHATLWATPDPNKETKDFKWHVDPEALVISPHEQEQAIAQNYVLAIFKYGNEINVYIHGELVNLGVRLRNPKAQLLYELAKARKLGRPTPSGKIRRGDISIVQTSGIPMKNDTKSRLRIFTNEAVAEHTKPIKDLIKADKDGWYLNLNHEQIYVTPL